MNPEISEREFLEALRYEDKFPPDCDDLTCKKCHACFSRYCQLKWEGALDE